MALLSHSAPSSYRPVLTRRKPRLAAASASRKGSSRGHRGQGVAKVRLGGRVSPNAAHSTPAERDLGVQRRRLQARGQASGLLEIRPARRKLRRSSATRRTGRRRGSRGPDVRRIGRPHRSRLGVEEARASAYPSLSGESLGVEDLEPPLPCGVPLRGRRVGDLPRREPAPPGDLRASAPVAGSKQAFEGMATGAMQEATMRTTTNGSLFTESCRYPPPPPDDRPLLVGDHVDPQHREPSRMRGDLQLPQA